MGAPLTLAVFEPLLDASFTVSNGVELRLAEASSLVNSGREGGSFRLEFHGPADSALPQGTYAFEIGGAAHDIFIVPIAARGDRLLYEAIFF
jgi:hypothetical protein